MATTTFPRLSSLLFVLLGLFQLVTPSVLEARVGGPRRNTDTVTNGGFYWYEEIDAGSARTIQDATLKGDCKKDYETMLVVARADGVVAPSVFAELFVAGRGIIGASSIKGRQAQAPQTCNILPAGGTTHRFYGNCAEMNALAIAVNLGWATFSSNRLVLPAGSAITAYGVRNAQTGAVGVLKPCDATPEFQGCSTLLPTAANLKIVTRDGDLEIEGLRAVEFKA